MKALTSTKGPSVKSIHAPNPLRKAAREKDAEHVSSLFLRVENIPEALKRHDRWMGTRQKRRPDGKRDKPPHRVRARLPVIKADKTNPENHASFEEAYDALRRGDVDAIGFVFTEDDPFTVIDLDGVLDPETGELDLRASEIVENFPTSWEISISERGLHGICIADKPGTRCRTGNIEMYDGRPGARFMVITGQRFPGASTEVKPCQEELAKLYNDLFGHEEKPQPAGRSGEGGGQGHSPDATELMKHIRNSPKSGPKFHKLYDRGDISGHASQSEADLALCGLLVWWTGGDEEQVAQMFRMSALYRPPPQKHRDYPERTTRKAARNHKGGYYKPRAVREKPVQEQHDILTPYLALLLDPTQWRGKKAPSAYKAYCAMVIKSTCDGIATDQDELQVAGDVRTFAEFSGTSRRTLSRSSLPWLIKQKRIRWQRGAGGRAGQFVLIRPKLPENLPSDPIKVYTQYFNGVTWGKSLDVLAKLIRMRSGPATTGKVSGLGKMQKVARLGMVAMFCMVVLTSGPQRVQKLEEMVERTGRDKYRIREAMEKLKGADIAEEPREGFYKLADGVWAAYERELKRSLIVKAEQRQRKQHQEERRIDEQKRRIKRGEKMAEHDPNVVSMAAKRRRDLDREARLNQPTDERTKSSVGRREPLWPDRPPTPEEACIQEEYDRMCERVQERLGRRRPRRPQTKGEVS
jgi:putative DNA primase/helicase